MTPKPIVPESTLVQQRQQGLALLTPLKAKVHTLTVTTPEEYALADGLLLQARQNKTTWLSRINPAIEPIRKGLDLLYDLRKDIVDPLDEFAEIIKEKMRLYKVEETRQLRAAEAARQKEIEELERQAAQKEEKESTARTKQLRERLSMQRAQIQQDLAEKRLEDAPAPLKVGSSSAKRFTKWRVTDIRALLTHLLESEDDDLLSLLAIDSLQMNAYFKITKPPIGDWMPGLVVEEDIRIAGKAGR